MRILLWRTPSFVASKSLSSRLELVLRCSRGKNKKDHHLTGRRLCDVATPVRRVRIDCGGAASRSRWSPVTSPWIASSFGIEERWGLVETRFHWSEMTSLPVRTWIVFAPTSSEMGTPSFWRLRGHAKERGPAKTRSHWPEMTSRPMETRIGRVGSGRETESPETKGAATSVFFFFSRYNTEKNNTTVAETIRNAATDSLSAVGVGAAASASRGGRGVGGTWAASRPPSAAVAGPSSLRALRYRSTMEIR